MRHHLLLTIALAGTLAGCAGQVRVNSGATGPALPSGSAVTLIGATPNDNPLLVQARQAVIAALAARGHAIVDDAPARLEMGLTDRLASTGIGLLGGAELSEAKKRKFLQSCKDRTYRLVLTHYGAGEQVPVTRAWAEEHHCKARLEDSIAGLADKAVASLARGSSSETTTRAGTD